MSVWAKVPAKALSELARAITAGDLRPKYRADAVARYVGRGTARALADELNRLAETGFGPAQLTQTLSLLAEERARTEAQVDRLSLVWSGPELAGATSRDTGVLVKELFERATTHLLLASYTVDEASKGRALFQGLAERMDQLPELEVVFYLNITRKFQNETPEATLIKAFAKRFREQVWPGKRLPSVYYDPRALEPYQPGQKERACLHAKCVVVDRAEVLITSANFTEAAQERNYEAGLLVKDPWLAESLLFQFNALKEHGKMQKLALTKAP